MTKKPKSVSDRDSDLGGGLEGDDFDFDFLFFLRFKVFLPLNGDFEFDDVVVDVRSTFFSAFIPFFDFN